MTPEEYFYNTVTAFLHKNRRRFIAVIDMDARKARFDRFMEAVLRKPRPVAYDMDEDDVRAEIATYHNEEREEKIAKA